MCLKGVDREKTVNVSLIVILTRMRIHGDWDWLGEDEGCCNDSCLTSLISDSQTRYRVRAATAGVVRGCKVVGGWYKVCGERKCIFQNYLKTPFFYCKLTNKVSSSIWLLFSH